MTVGAPRPLLLSGGAAIAGATVVAVDLAGQTGASPFLSILELVCGLAAGLGFAALWLRGAGSRTEKSLFFFLLAVHIFAVWPWIPFAVGLATEDPDRPGADRRWFGRACAVLILTAAAIGGTGVIYRGLFPPGLPMPAWMAAAGGMAAAAASWLAARRGLALSRRDALGVLCRMAAVSAGILAAAMLVRLRVWRPEPPATYAATAAGLLAAGYGAYRLRLPDAVRRAVRIPAVCTAILFAGWIALDHYLDLKYWKSRTGQQLVFERNIRGAAPLVEACRICRERRGAWPDSPETLAAFLAPDVRPGAVAATGCHTEANGDFLLVLQYRRQLPVFARRFRPDGTESWEILAANHPLQPPGAKRWKHPFPYTD